MSSPLDAGFKGKGLERKNPKLVTQIEGIFVRIFQCGDREGLTIVSSERLWRIRGEGGGRDRQTNRQRERETETETDRQTESQRDRQRDRQTETDRESDRQTDRQRVRERERVRESERDRQTYRESERERQTERENELIIPGVSTGRENDKQVLTLTVTTTNVLRSEHDTPPVLTSGTAPSRTVTHPLPHRTEYARQQKLIHFQDVSVL